MVNAVVGANELDHHMLNANLERDFQVEVFADLREAQPGIPAPAARDAWKEPGALKWDRCSSLAPSIPGPWVQPSWMKTAKAPMVMGCYGIGVGRTVAAVIENNHDDDGIIWPVSIAPYHVIVVPVSMKDEAQAEAGQKLYEELQAAGVEVVLDDRNERPGVKFKDADLIGFPIRDTIGSKSLEQGAMEITIRRTGEKMLVPAADVVSTIENLLKDGETR